MKDLIVSLTLPEVVALMDCVSTVQEENYTKCPNPDIKQREIINILDGAYEKLENTICYYSATTLE